MLVSLRVALMTLQTLPISSRVVRSSQRLAWPIADAAPLIIVASGHGLGEANALRDLLATLRERHEAPDLIAFVSDDYQVRAGKSNDASGANGAERARSGRQ
jgi:hypothetical protein